MFSQNRTELRQFLITVWQKYQQQQPLEPLEVIIKDVILAHPEYHSHLQVNKLEFDYLPQIGQTNPFLHLSLHIALHEQLAANRPTGIRALYLRGCKRLQDPHKVEHLMLDCLAQTLWEAQHQATIPNEQAYIACLRHKLR